MKKSKHIMLYLMNSTAYHLLASSEREKCVSEVYRVLKPNGIVFVNFIPYLSGAIGVVDRTLSHPQQVDKANLAMVFASGQFVNNADVGFQEGYYPPSEEIVTLFQKHHFTQMLLRSIRGFGYNKEEQLDKLKEQNKPLYDEMIALINKTAANPAIIETCGHALLVARKCPHAL